METASCTNCARPALAGDRYCSACGQRLVAPALTLRGLATQLGSAVFSTDAVFPRTLIGLLFRPGSVADAWVRGRRRAYAGPLPVIVFVGIVAGFVQGPLAELRAANIPVGEPVYGAALTTRTSQLVLLLTCVAVPVGIVTAAVARLMNVTRTWLEWTILGLYCYGIAAALQLTVLALGAASSTVARSDLALWIESLLPIASFAWGSAAFVREHRLRAVGAAVLGQALVVAVAVALSRAFES